MRVIRTGHCAIIGAGLAGLTAAACLKERGVPVTLFEKSARPGGRIAARETQIGTFNHGAPSIECESDAFRAFLLSLGASETAGGRVVGTPHMRAPLETLARDLHIRRNALVEGLERLNNDWYVVTEGGARHGPFRVVVFTAPAPQSARMLRRFGPDIGDEIAGVAMDPVWTTLLSFPGPVLLPATIAGGQSVAAAPDASGASTKWVVHMGPEWTRERLELDPAFAAAFALEEIEGACGARLPGTRYLAAHRWRFARASVPLGRPFAGCAERRLWVGGDWTLGRRAEDAWTSGRALAQVAGRVLADA